MNAREAQRSTAPTLTRNPRARRYRSLWAGALLVLLSLSIALLASDREPLAMDDRARRQLPGHFVALSDGYTNYEIVGPERGPVVLLIPGISIPRGVFGRTIAPLAEAGYRVVTFDLYGRGFSDRPRVRYDAALFNRQIDDLLGALRIDGRCPPGRRGVRRIAGDALRGTAPLSGAESRTHCAGRCGRSGGRVRSDGAVSARG